MTISIIVAVANNLAIGKDNSLLWHISEDLKRFKALTSGHAIIMGRKTYESIGRPLPGRHNIVVSRNNELKIEGVTIVSSLEKAIEVAKNDGETEAFVMGGGQLYAATIDIADRLYVTEVDCSLDADTFFPAIESERWRETSRESSSDDKYRYSFVNYERK